MLTFEQALELYRTRTDRRRSVLLAPHTRLVPLAEDRFGVQYYNTYVIRILKNGLYVINVASRLCEEVVDVVATYSPLKLVRKGGGWVNQHGQDFHNSSVVNAKGELVDSKQIVPFKEV